jgi:hypothetical protein
MKLNYRNTKSLLSMIVMVFLTVLSILSKDTYAQYAASSCNSSIKIVSSSAQPNGSGFQYTITLINQGSASASAKLSSSVSSIQQSIPAQQTVSISVPFNSCSASITLSVSQTAKVGTTSSTSTCSASVTIGGCCAPNKPPVCDAGGPYTNLDCSATPIQVQIDGSKSSDPEKGSLSYKWTSNCPSANFDNASLAKPKLSLITAPSNTAQPSTSCAVNLTVTDPNNLSSSCSAPVTSKVCQRDCLNVINGSAQLDRCGVCNGDGSSCFGCSSVNISGNQFIMDNNANELRDNILKINKQLNIGSKNAKLSSQQLQSEMNYISASSDKAQVEYIQAWNTIYTQIPQTILSCTAAFCVNTSTAGYKVDVRQDTQDLLRIAKASYARLKNVEKKARQNKAKGLRKVQNALKKAADILEDSEELASDTTKELGQVPANQSSC